ncbi:MAG: hypothetical protein WCC48_03275 [Anaeromyxobacteraceae bacterium]
MLRPNVVDLRTFCTPDERRAADEFERLVDKYDLRWADAPERRYPVGWMRWPPGGWFPLVERLIVELTRLGWNRQLVQASSKIGRLRFCVGEESAAMRAAIRRAEMKSLRVCDERGATGGPKDGPHHLTRCCRYATIPPRRRGRSRPSKAQLEFLKANTTKLVPMDLGTKTERRKYWDAAQAEAVSNDDPGMALGTLRDIARASGIENLARRAECTRAMLRATLRHGERADFVTVVKIAWALGLPIAMPLPRPTPRS